MILEASQLRGWPKERAELYGKPHLGARYTGKRRGWGLEFKLVAPGGTWDLRSPLFALCGSGTTGCHGRFHGAGLKAEWRWRHPVYEEAWWTGQLLEVYEPHDPGLYEYGYWAIVDKDGNEIIREGK